jgi:hypothetical protein
LPSGRVAPGPDPRPAAAGCPRKEVRMDTSAAALAAGAVPGYRRLHRMNVFLSLVALASWWELGLRQGAELGAARPLNLAVAAAIMVLARLAASGVEALAYTVWWRTRGARLPYARFLVALVALSLVDRFAQDLAALAGREPALAPWLAPLAGLQLLAERWSGVEPGARAAFGGLGLLALARIGITAWLQSAGTGRHLREALLVTVTAWFATRVALWWTMDLMRGMSPLR